RQLALRSTIEWSYGLQDEGEKTLFRRLSVFAGGCTLEAAEAVCAGPEFTKDGTLGVDVFVGIESLVDRSLVRSVAGRAEQATRGGGEPRFSMLETVREYARERLEESGEAQATKQRHASYYLALAEKGEYQTPLPGHSIWLEKVETEQDNMRAALQWS